MSSRAFSTVFAVVTFVAAAAGGCTPSDQADGSSCSDKSECASRLCSDGFCAGRDGCSVTKPCDPGWTCVDSPAGLFSSFSSRCNPACGHCPERLHCPITGVPEKTQCAPGPTRKATIEGPAVITAGIAATFTLKLDPPATFESYTWSIIPRDAFEPKQQDTSTVVPTIDFPVDANLRGADGQRRILLEARNINLTGDRKLDSVEAVLDVTITCSAVGQDCSGFGTCCASGICESQTGSSARICK